MKEFAQKDRHSHKEGHVPEINRIGVSANVGANRAEFIADSGPACRQDIAHFQEKNQQTTVTEIKRGKAEGQHGITVPLQKVARREQRHGGHQETDSACPGCAEIPDPLWPKVIQIAQQDSKKQRVNTEMGGVMRDLSESRSSLSITPARPL